MDWIRAAMADCVEVPGAWHTFERVIPAVVELDPRPRDEIPDRSGDEDLVGFGQRRDPGADVHGNATDIVAGKLDLTRVEPDPNPWTASSITRTIPTRGESRVASSPSSNDRDS